MFGWFGLVFQLLCGGLWTCFLLFTFTLSATSKEHARMRYMLRMLLTWVFVIPMFFLSSLVASFFQLCSRLSHFLPFSSRIYWAQTFAYFWWLVCQFCTEFWPNTKYYLHVETNGINIEDVNKSSTVMTMNHAESPFDWVAAAAYAGYLNRMQRMIAMMKQVFMYYPSLGWIGYLSGSLPLSRSWQHDMPRLKKIFPIIASEYPKPFTFGIYPEGTRQTPKKLEEAKAFAKERGYPVLTHLLQPRVKGFRFLIHQLRSSVPYIIDLTTIYHPKPPSMQKYLYTGRLHERTDMYVRVYRVEELPSDDDGLDQWLRDRWTEKDQIIDATLRGEIEYGRMKRDPLKQNVAYGGFWLLFTLKFYYFLGWSPSLCMVWLITALFPIWIVLMERDDDKTATQREQIRRLSQTGMNVREYRESQLAKDDPAHTKPPVRDGFDIESDSENDDVDDG